MLRPITPTTFLVRRTYALSRFPRRPTGAGRTRPNHDLESKKEHLAPEIPVETHPSDQESQLWRASRDPLPPNPQDSLQRLLANNRLVIERQIEMLNIFVGFEQSNKYSISNELGETIGYIAEEPKGILAIMARQAFATHRPFRAIIMDTSGAPLLWLRRPFSWINSRMYVQRLSTSTNTREGDTPELDTFAEVQQLWHIWRRRYDLFIRSSPRRILTPLTERQPEPEITQFHQFAKVDAGFLSWNFALRGPAGEQLAFISRAFRGFGREIFTDTGQYTVYFGPRPLEDTQPQVASSLTNDQRAAILALAVNIDSDYFSRHSGAGSGGLMGFSHWE